MTALLAETPARSTGSPTSWNPLWGPAPRWATERTPSRPTYGAAVAKIAKALGKTLLPWQRYVVDVALEVDEVTGELAYDEVIIFAQRRSGKTVLIEPVTVHRCGQPVKREAWLTAQKRDNAVRRWRGATDVVLGSSLAPKVHRIISNSKESLTWTGSGSRFLPFAPDEDSMHGEDPDLVWVDELWSLTLEQRRLIQQGYKPAWSVKPGQEWKMSAAGTARSGWMKHERTRGRAAVEAGGRSRIAYFEWCVPESWRGVLVQDLDDEVLLQLVLDNHPRRDHGLRGGVEFLAQQLSPDGLGRAGFLRAYGGLDEDESTEETVIPQSAFTRALTSVGIPQDARVGVAFDVDPDRREASVSAAWRDPSTGVALTKVLRRAEGTRWAAGFVQGVVERNDVGAVAMNNAGPARDVADELEQAGVQLLRVVQGDYAAACSRFGDEISDVAPGARPTVTHDGDLDLAMALRAAGLRRLPAGGQAWTSKTGEPITTLVSHTLAVWAADHLPEPETKHYGWSAF